MAAIFPAHVFYIFPNQGSLFVGDTIQVTPGENAVSFMYSYPNMTPLSKNEILQIDNSIANLNYDTMYGAFGKYIRKGAKAIMKRSV